MMDLRPFLWFCGGLLLWANAFVSLYAALSIGCAASWQGRLTVTLAVIWALHLLAGVTLHVLSWRRAAALASGASATQRFLAVSSVWLMALGWIGILFVGWPLLLLEPCR